MPGREWADAEYSRIYWTVVDDEKFAEVYDDDRRWAAYTRLLMAAEATYPSPAALPRWLEDDVLEHLVEVRIVELVRGHAYRIVGLQSEREGRLGGNRVGGTVRAAGAQRDEHGRFLAGETLDDAGDAGPAAGQDAGPASLESSEPARRGRVRDEDETRDSPNPAQRGRRVNPRANGTNPRAQGTSPRQVGAEQTKAKRWRSNQRELAYHRGAITEAQLGDMQKRDAPLNEIPDWQAHLASMSPSWVS